jgi:hypothetical protein
MVEVSWISFMDPDPAREYLALATLLPRKNFWSLMSFFRQDKCHTGSTERLERINWILDEGPYSRQESLDYIGLGR